MMRQKLFCLIALCLLTLHLAAQSVDKHPLKLRVATYNVGHFNQGVAGGLEVRGEAVYGKEGKQRYARLEMLNWREWISEQSIDFLGVQEWNKYFDADSAFHAEEELLKPFYNNVYFGDEHKWIYNGIATNYKLTNLRQKYWAGDYYALIGDLRVGNKTVTVMSTHIPWQKEWHKPALDSFLAEMKKYEYLICMGDMNATDAEQLRFREEGFHMANGGHQGWFGTAAGSLKLDGRTGGADKNIDNIITSKNIKIMNVSVPHTGLNDQDHLPVMADVVIAW
jgi:endonuclease/exonuclease/phosphatase family metal-dependent hydrolase